MTVVLEAVNFFLFLLKSNTCTLPRGLFLLSNSAATTLFAPEPRFIVVTTVFTPLDDATTGRLRL